MGMTQRLHFLHRTVWRKKISSVLCVRPRMEHPWHRCGNGAGLVSLHVSQFLGQAVWRTYSSLLLLWLHYPWQQGAKGNIPWGSSLLQPPGGAHWSSWCRTHLRPNLLLKSRPTTRWKQGDKHVGGLLWPHMTKHNFYPILSPPFPWQAVAWQPCIPASLHHRCSAVVLLPCSPSFAPGLGTAMLTRAPSSLQAEISSPLQCLEAGGSQEDEDVEDAAHGLRHGELCSSWCLPCADSGQGGVGSQ